MALVRRSFQKEFPLIFRQLSTKQNIQKSVFISQSNDVFANLALEEWLHKNFDFSNHHILMFYRNNPSVVVGKQQNPWSEINADMADDGIDTARRRGDGATVYNDSGTLNMTFFTENKNLQKDYNLDIVARAAFRAYNLKINAAAGGLNIRQRKICETSTVLGSKNSFFQCSLLVDIDKRNYDQLLQSPKDTFYVTNPSNLDKSKILNLREENPKVKIDKLLNAIGWEYMRTLPLELRDGGLELANKQRGFQMINPTNEWFPGLDAIKRDLQSWDWCYGQTPTFSVSKKFAEDIEATILVEKGRIADIKLLVPPRLSPVGFSGTTSVISNLKGQKYTENMFETLEKSLECIGHYPDKLEHGIHQVTMSI